LVEQMRKQGIRADMIDGSMSSDQKEAARQKFNPAKGGVPETDVLICTDSCQTGLNLQRSKWLAHLDVPMTDKAFQQRNARMYRRGQDEDVTVHLPLLDAPEERIALARVQRKAELGNLVQSRSDLLDDSGLTRLIENDRAMNAA